MDPNGLARLWGNHKVSTLPAGQTEAAVTVFCGDDVTSRTNQIMWNYNQSSGQNDKFQFCFFFYFKKKSHQTLRVFKLALNKKRQKILKSSTTFFFLTQRMFERNLISLVKIKEAGCGQM